MRLILALIFAVFAFTAVPAQAQVASTFSLSDCSVALTGVSQTLVAANPNRKYLWIYNSGNAIAYLNMAGGTAAITGVSSVGIASGASVIVTTPNVFRGAVTIIGTAAQPVTCYEGR